VRIDRLSSGFPDLRRDSPPCFLVDVHEDDPSPFASEPLPIYMTPTSWLDQLLGPALPDRGSSGGDGGDAAALANVSLYIRRQSLDQLEF
jgi:hypothetical protein